MAAEHKLASEQAAAGAAALMHAEATPRHAGSARQRVSLLHYAEVTAVLAVVLALVYFAGLGATLAMLMFFVSLAGLVALRVIAMRH